MEVRHQGVKEDTFIQTGRKGRDGQRDTENSQQGGGWRTRAGKVAASRAGSLPHSCADKPGGTTGKQKTDHTTQGSSSGK